MTLYIDKENILSFISGRNTDIDLFNKSVSLIKEGMSVYYNFSKEEIKGSSALLAWFNRMNGCGVNFGHVFCPEADIFPERPVKTNFYNNFNTAERSSIFLLNIEESTCENIRNKHAIIIGRPGDEYNIFNALFNITKRTRLMPNIKSWSDYLPLIPLTDAILSDNHYFKDKWVYNKNKNELIEALASIAKDTLNLVIIVSEKEIDSQLNLEDECKNIKELISKKSGLSKKKCAVTIMTTYITHSRHIITNLSFGSSPKRLSI